MKHYNNRIALRIEALEREKIDKLILQRKFKNLSQLIRTALNEFLNKPEVNKIIDTQVEFSEESK